MPAKPPRAERRSGRWRAPLLLLLPFPLLLALHGALWLWAVGRLEAGFAAWAAARRAEGWTIAHGRAEPAGWPLAAALRLPGLRLDPGTAGPAITWQAEDPVTLALRPAALDRLEVALAGRHRLGLDGGDPVPLAAGRLDLTLPLRATAAGVPPWAGLAAEALRLDPDGAGRGAAVETAALAIELRPEAGRGEAALALRLRMAGLDLPADAGMAVAMLGRRVSVATLDLSLSGPVPPSRFPAEARARAWRDGGGALLLREVRLHWGPAEAALEGRVVLDRALQPAGEGRMRLGGAATLLDMAVAAGLLAPRAAGLARATLPLLESAPPPGSAEAPSIEAPVSLDRGVVSVARLPWLRLPAWSWRAP